MCLAVRIIVCLRVSSFTDGLTATTVDHHRRLLRASVCLRLPTPTSRPTDRFMCVCALDERTKCNVVFRIDRASPSTRRRWQRRECAAQAFAERGFASANQPKQRGYARACKDDTQGRERAARMAESSRRFSAMAQSIRALAAVLSRRRCAQTKLCVCSEIDAIGAYAQTDVGVRRRLGGCYL